MQSGRCIHEKVRVAFLRKNFNFVNWKTLLNFLSCHICDVWNFTNLRPMQIFVQPLQSCPLKITLLRNQVLDAIQLEKWMYCMGKGFHVLSKRKYNKNTWVLKVCLCCNVPKIDFPFFSSVWPYLWSSLMSWMNETLTYC